MSLVADTDNEHAIKIQVQKVIYSLKGNGQRYKVN